MIRLFITDDYPVVRRGLIQIFGETYDIRVTNEAASYSELLEKIEMEDFDVLLLDFSISDNNSLDVIKSIKNQMSELPILIFTMYPEEQYALRLLKSGVSGYLNKKSSPEEIIDAVRVVFAGRKYISPHLAELLAMNIDSSGEVALHEKLSGREFQVMCMIAAGKTVTEIAKELTLSVNTISTYRLRILEKFKMKNNAEINQYAIKNQLLS